LDKEKEGKNERRNRKIKVSRCLKKERQKGKIKDMCLENIPELPKLLIIQLFMGF
jgi:hypothetical protein